MAAFALDLAPDGIRFLARDGDVWTTLETARLEDPDLAARMADMRAEAVARAGADFETALIIPETVILYTKITAPEGETPTDAHVAAALDGLTPCPVDEMVFDWRQDGDRLWVAALDMNTLAEAEEFAVAHGLNPCGFTARPSADQFPGAPDFGPTQGIQADAAPARVKKAPAPAKPRPTAEPATVAPLEPAAEPSTAQTGVLAAFATHRKVIVTGAGVLGSAAILLWSAAALMSPGGVGPDAVPAIELGATEIPQPSALAALEQRTPEDAVAGQVVLAPAPETQNRRADHTIRVPELGGTPAQSTEERALAEALPAAGALRGAPPPLASAPALGPVAPAPRREASLFAPDATAFGPDAELPPPIEFVAIDAATVWQTPPPPGASPAGAVTDDIYTASIDPQVGIGDAFALPEAAPDPILLSRPGLLPGPGQIFDLDDRGFVRATPEGAVSPQGVIVTEGAPDLSPPTRPVNAVPDTSDAIAEALAAPRPRVRPGDLIENAERARLGGRTTEELSGLRPEERPASAQAAALAAVATTAPSAQAIAQSRVPTSRPQGFDARVAEIRNRAAQAQQAAASAQAAAAATAAAVAAAPSEPSIPTTASVARQATIDGALNLRRLNLIGVYGSETDRRALIRLSSGRYVKVRVGDSVDGGQVASIGDSELRLIKGGRNVTLTVPQS